MTSFKNWRLCISLVGSPAIWFMLAAAHPPLTFIPAGPQLSRPAQEYRAIWERDGEQIVSVMER